MSLGRFCRKWPQAIFDKVILLHFPGFVNSQFPGKVVFAQPSSSPASSSTVAAIRAAPAFRSSGSVP